MGITNPITVGVDGSASALDAVRWAAQEALRRRLGLRVLHAWGMSGIHYGSGIPMPASVFDTLQQDATQVLEEAVETARSLSPKLSVTGEMPYEPPVLCLVERSRTAGLIVLGSTGRGGFVGMLAGSTAVGVSAHSRCPVAVIRGTEREGPVVVGVDGSPAGEPAVALAFDEAAEHDVPLVAVHAWADLEYDSFYGSPRYFGDTDTFAEEEQRLLSESLAGYQEKYPDVAVERVIVRDRPRHQLLLWSERARMVVVGSRGRGGFRGLLLGSTSQALIHHAKCPVLITRSG